MFAVFESGGKQHRAVEGEVVRLERLASKPGDRVVFDRVLMIAEGDDIAIGAPWVEGGRVTGEVVDQGRSRKITVIKFKRRKNYLRKKGHRQCFTDVRITAIARAPAVGDVDAESDAAASQSPTDEKTAA